MRSHHSDRTTAPLIVVKYRLGEFVSYSKRRRLILSFTPENSSVPAKRTIPSVGVQKTIFPPSTHA